MRRVSDPSSSVFRHLTVFLYNTFFWALADIATVIKANKQTTIFFIICKTIKNYDFNIEIDNLVVL